ncbi:MAG: hypothetical protein Q9221_000160 [Calogaya cf. arnoldii]
MSAIADLRITSFDIAFAKEGHVLLRYSAEGSHCGEPHNDIAPTGNKAKWHAAAIFEVRDGKVYSFTKEWDKLHMWKQLGWMRGDECPDSTPDVVTDLDPDLYQMRLATKDVRIAARSDLGQATLA